MGGAMVFPAFVDMHTHLDKGHIWGRAPNPTAPSWAR
jgi:cytosine deaminase